MGDLRVLVAADSVEEAQRLAGQVLPGAGYVASVADDFNEPPPCDLVLVEVTRLRVSPFALIKAQRRMGCFAPALLLAPRLTDEMAAEMFSLGIRDFIQTPVDDRALIDRLGTFASYILQEQAQAQLREELRQTQASLQRRLEEMNALSRIGRSITSITDTGVILSRIVEAAAYLTRADAGAIFLLDESTGQVLLRAEQGFGQDQASLIAQPSADSDVMAVVHTGQPVMRGGEGEHKIKTGFMVRALINAPVIVGQRVVGVLGVYRHGAGSFEVADQATVIGLADYVAIALDKVSSLDGISRQVDAALESSRTVMFHAQTLHDPIEGIESLAQTLLAGDHDPLTERQAAAVTRIRNATIRLREVMGYIRDILAEFERQ